MSDTPVVIRPAVISDLEQMIALLAEDPLGRTREDPRMPLERAYFDAFAAIEDDPNQHLVVAAREDRIVGMLQLTFIPGLSRQGAWRGQIESVRTAQDTRRTGLGRRLFEWAFDACRAHGCGLVQLTTDASRNTAHEFYEALGFEPSHIGYKRDLRGS
ncbi:MAG TPA: GNAT family N-acetyltransferase [Roseovarius sp.]